MFQNMYPTCSVHFFRKKKEKKMWDQKDFVEDTEKIKRGQFSGLAVTSKPRPSDSALLFRYNYITLLSLFKRNDFVELRNHSNAYLESIDKYLEEWNPDYIDTGIASPPFDFCLLVYMTATNGDESYNKLIRLFRFYKKFDDYLATQNVERQILLTDKPRTDQQMTKVGIARKVIKQRLNYLAENITSLLHTLNKKEILLSFLNNFVQPEEVGDNQSLSCFGRLALSCGDRETATKYFDLVKDNQIKTLNKGYTYYFDNNYKEAFNCFNGKLQSASEACKLHMGDISTDISNQPSTTQKPTAESLSQWPAPPRSTK